MKFPPYYARREAGLPEFLGTACSHPRILAASLAIARDALRGFFIPQFGNAVFKARPVVFVDHPVDGGIPFEPALVDLYLSFIPYWMGIAHRLSRSYGRAGAGSVARFLGFISTMYTEAGSVYAVAHSSTVRPDYKANLRFAMIHALDPHLNCVPSLHVTLVLGAWMRAGETVKAMGDGDDPGAKAWLESVRDKGMRITESILMMKQHSVNCVGASLYYLNARFPESFTDPLCRNVMEELFTREGRDMEARFAARETMIGLYDDLRSRDAANGTGWKDGLLGFLDRYGHANGSLAPGTALVRKGRQSTGAATETEPSASKA